jgi:hypothetical protein
MNRDPKIRVHIHIGNITSDQTTIDDLRIIKIISIQIEEISKTETVGRSPKHPNLFQV